MSRWNSLLLGAAGLILGAQAYAQCSIVPGTGCGLPPLKDCNSNPSIGTLFCMNVLSCPAGCGSVQFNVWFVGPPSPVPISLPGCCATVPCVIYAPVIHHVQLRPAPGLECYAIPNLPSLIGAMLALQPVCFDPATACMNISPALMITIR